MLNIPLFPLQTVLFPGGVLPLRIFEVRYLHMVEECYRMGTPFGIVSLAEGSEVRTPTAPTERFHPVGVLAHIARLQMLQPGLLMLDCRGSQRFRIDSKQQPHFGLWTADVTLIAEDAASPIPPDLQHSAKSLDQLIQTLHAKNANSGWLPQPETYQLNDCAWVANRWCELLPLSVLDKHNLMALESPLLRLELVADILAQTHFSDTPLH
ncbi:MAG: LON peptidase substrate-binding domain-containing protein [Burkholderiales bacterium]|nr:LON peptidase substrate-binding domain-containing protein [Burkholderiales bacterium]